MAQALFVDRNEIVKFTALNGNIDPDKFIQFCKIAQDIHIQQYLGTRLFKKINDGIVNNNLVNSYAFYNTLLWQQKFQNLSPILYSFQTKFLQV